MKCKSSVALILAAATLTGCNSYKVEENVERYGSRSGPTYAYEYVGDDVHRIYRDNWEDRKGLIRERCIKEPGEVMGVLVTVCQWTRVR